MKLVLVRGLPGSGKSTLARMLAYVHLEADMYFMVDGVYRFDKNKLHAAHAWCLERTRASLDHHLTVAVSNTFTTKKELKPYFDLAKEYDIIPNVILCQNQFNNVHNVPIETLEKMKARFQYDISSLF